MTDDDREHKPWGQEGEEPEIYGEEDEAGDPAAAFEALRAKLEDLSADLRREMVTIRKGVEAAFDQFEKVGTTNRLSRRSRQHDRAAPGRFRTCSRRRKIAASSARAGSLCPRVYTGRRGFGSRRRRAVPV